MKSNTFKADKRILKYFSFSLFYIRTPFYLFNDSYALKTICSDDRDQTENEINLMQMFDHPHIVKFYGEFNYSSDIRCIVMEYCEVTN